jgi:hypothetical protein
MTGYSLNHNVVSEVNEFTLLQINISLMTLVLFIYLLVEYKIPYYKVQYSNNPKFPHRRHVCNWWLRNSTKAKHVGMTAIYLGTKFHDPYFRGSLVVPIKI